MVLLPTTWVKNLGRLAYVSATGVFACVIVMGAVIWVGLFSGVRFHEKGSLVNLSGIPMAASIYALCFAGHGDLPTIIESMKDRSKGSKLPSKSYFLFARSVVSLSLRTMMVAITIIVALIFPVFWSMMAFIRSFLGSTIALILLCICYLKIFEGTKSCKVEKVIVMGILMIGFCIATLETYFNVKRIMQQM